MNFTLKNNSVSIAVKQYGAELSSFKSEDSNIEYLWQGNPDVWYGQSPILFPIVGTLLDNKYKVDGKEYEMFRHGIARKRDFELKEQGEDYITLTQKWNEESLERYPFKYVLDIEFKLCGKKLTVTHTVKNEGDGAMYFSIGAHPGFNCKIDTDSILDGKHYPTLDNETTIVITKDIFEGDALVLSGMKSDTVYLKSDFRPQYIKFNFGKAPVLGIWAKPGAEYVCIEPWYGVCIPLERRNNRIKNIFPVCRKLFDKRGFFYFIISSLMFFSLA